MPSDQQRFFALQRSLSILRHLQREAADRFTLMELVQLDVGFDSYEEVQSKAAERAFEGDIKRLKDLGVDIAYDRKANCYRLGSYGDFCPVGLSEEMLNTLAFLSETFEPETPNGDRVQQLIRTIADWLPTSQRDSLAGRRQRLRIDLRRKDDDEVPPVVQNAIDRAINQRRLLRFAYRSPSQADGVPRVHTVQPWGMHFDTVRRHLYLDAYRVQVSGPYGDRRKRQWQRYRPGRILEGDIEVLPDRLPPEPPRRVRHRLEYLLAPAIARLGEITRHFDDMEIHETNKDGWVRVTATTDDLFRAVRSVAGVRRDVHSDRREGGTPRGASNGDENGRVLSTSRHPPEKTGSACGKIVVSAA